MLALVRLHASPQYQSIVRCFEALPAEPVRLSGAAVRCDDLRAVEAALAWRRRYAGVNAVFPFAMVVPRDAAIARCIALEAVAPCALLFDDEVPGFRLPDEVMERLWQGSILVQLEEVVLNTTDAQVTPRERAVLRQVVAAGAEGRRAASAAMRAGMSESTLRRWLHERGLPPAGALLRRIRLEAVRRLERAGMDPRTASRLCGWSDVRASRMARMRAGARQGGGLRLNALAGAD